MDVLPLPPRPSLEQYKKRAKNLVKVCRSDGPAAIRPWATEWVESIAETHGTATTQFVQGSFERAVSQIEQHIRTKYARTDDRRSACQLADAQFLLARAHGFESWPKFAAHVEAAGHDAPVFERAADAVVDGEREELSRLLTGSPALIRERSSRRHSATLLHYVSANGVEDFRQKTPGNAVEIARLLLDAGSAVDALAETYGGGREQTTMNLVVSSMHPAAAGLQVALVDTLLDYGAAVNGLENLGSPLFTALAFDHLPAADALVRRGARVDNLVTAAAMGHLDLVRAVVVDGGELRAGTVVPSPRWPALPADARGLVAFALIWAAKFGREAVVEFLLDQGVDIAATDIDAMTALHAAAANGHLDVMEVLIARGAPLEVQNRWGGTVLDSTAFFAYHAPDGRIDYEPVLERLIAAGARIQAVGYPTGHEVIDRVMKRHL